LQAGESLQKLFDSVTIPLLCTYTSEVFSSGKHIAVQDISSMTELFKKEYEDEVQKLKTQLAD
jgi:hypothetical protein